MRRYILDNGTQFVLAIKLIRAIIYDKAVDDLDNFLKGLVRIDSHNPAGVVFLLCQRPPVAL